MLWRCRAGRWSAARWQQRCEASYPIECAEVQQLRPACLFFDEVNGRLPVRARTTVCLMRLSLGGASGQKDMSLTVDPLYITVGRLLAPATKSLISCFPR